jgi:hypothetical protein
MAQRSMGVAAMAEVMMASSSGSCSALGLGAGEGEGRGGDVAQIVDSVKGDERGDALVEGGGSGRELAAHAAAEQRDAGAVDFGAGQGVVQYGADHVLPVGTEHQALVMAGARLAGTVEGQHVVAALDGRGRAEEVHLLHRAVEPVVHDHGRPDCGGAVGTVQVAGQDGALVRDLHRLDGRGEQRRRLAERVH